ncbi:unnamed protein product [Lactuca saligna]|uniref:Retrotransposon gag domain-containing protein n=1 Tax=Lactuca saligna TaxID=75948 RepID=A0AA35UPR4_LACSI|nr:unnamed protein product [Lactuca saligna]
MKYMKTQGKGSGSRFIGFGLKNIKGIVIVAPLFCLLSTGCCTLAVPALYAIVHLGSSLLPKGTLSYGHINGKSLPTSEDDEEWYSVDARIKSWFYSTCDPSLLQIISSDDCTAKDLWDKLDEFLRNNKMSRMLQLQDQFRNTKKGSSSITEFGHTLKNLADDLKDVDFTITDIELVM